MTTVIHHSADYDGIFCREIARKFLPGAELIGWDFKDAPVVLQNYPNDQEFYILDLPPDCLSDGEWGSRVIWIDHHKSSIEKWGTSLPGYRIDGVAACRLAWQWFTRPEDPDIDWLPSKEDFIERKVKEPLAVRLTGEYDIWDKRDPDAEVFQYGLRFVEQGADFWEALLATDGVGEKAVHEILEHGKIAQRYQQKIDKSVIEGRSFIVRFEGLKFLCLNTAKCNSLTFAAKDVPGTGHDALLGFYWSGPAWNISLYHAKHRTDLDLSKIAVKYGGGGHRGACGFQINGDGFGLPFTNGGL